MVVTALSVQEKFRLNTLKSVDNSLMKRVASSWHECLSTFEMDWSPWAVPSTVIIANSDREKGQQQRELSQSVEGTLSNPRAALYELSEHKDTRMRRMLLTRTSDTIDHRNDAYDETKSRYQSLVEAGIDLPSPSLCKRESQLPRKHGFVPMLPLLMSVYRHFLI